jgi:hypothetical protein
VIIRSPTYSKVSKAGICKEGALTANDGRVDLKYRTLAANGHIRMLAALKQSTIISAFSQKLCCVATHLSKASSNFTLASADLTSRPFAIAVVNTVEALSEYSDRCFIVE